MPAEIVTVENPDDAVVSVALLAKLIVVIAEPTEPVSYTHLTLPTKVYV